MRLNTMASALMAVSLGLAVATPVGAVVVYSNTFDAAATVAGGVSATIAGAGAAEGSQGYSAYGFGSTLFRNASFGNPAAVTSLTLTGLQAHTSLSLSFLFAAIDSWDGFSSSAQGCAADIYSVKLDGVLVFSSDFGNVRDGSCGAHDQTYGTSNALLFPTNANIDGTGTSTDVGFNTRWNDAAYNMALESLFQNIAHTGSSATLEFFAGGEGWQGGDDESWGIDNIQVSLSGVRDGNDVPEPGSLGLLALALASAAMRRRRKA